MNIAFFISDHGFGHIMRNLPVIRELIERGHNIILVSGDKHLKIAEQYICEEAEEKKLGQLIRISYHSALRLIGDNVEYLDVAISNTQDYVKAADYCIAKAGWSTVSEMMLSGNPFAVITRPDVPEDTMIIEQLERRQAALAISVEELRDLESVLYKLENREWSHVSDENSYKIVVDIILS